jgi:hypothetical protein
MLLVSIVVPDIMFVLGIIVSVPIPPRITSFVSTASVMVLVLFFFAPHQRKHQPQKTNRNGNHLHNRFSYTKPDTGLLVLHGVFPGAETKKQKWVPVGLGAGEAIRQVAISLGQPVEPLCAADGSS